MNPRSARVLVVLLFSIKLLLTGWNVWAFSPSASFDARHHRQRVLDGGIVPRQRSYNGPLYYMPALPHIWLGETSAQRLTKEIQATNVVYLTAFYAIWLFWLLPRILPHWTNATVASVVLLALPGFQRLAACVHPDNLAVMLSSACFACWYWSTRRRVVGWAGSLGNAIVVGLTGLTRPFAIVPVAVFTLLLGLRQLGRRLTWRGLARAATVTAVAAVLAGSWWAVRVATLEKPMNVYLKANAKWQARRGGFDYVHYYGSFHLDRLLETPNRKISRHFKGGLVDNPYANSFFTTLYSEVWGDHWLYFSKPGEQTRAGGPWGPARPARFRDAKRDFKAALFVTALPLTALLLWRLVTGSWFALRQAVRRRAITPASVATLVFYAGFAMFVTWQVTHGLQPGRNSTIKFHYMAFSVAFALVPAFFRVYRRQWAFTMQLAIALAVYLAALPVAAVWP